MVVCVNGAVAVGGETIGGQVAAGRHDGIAGSVNIALAVSGPGLGHELHRPLSAGSTHPGNAAEAGLDEVDGCEVVPGDTGGRLRFAVQAQ